MKTKISHLGRSTVSVILAVMMLLSTMLVGTITTVSAYDISQNVTIYYANTEKWSSTPNLYYWGNGWNNNVDLENISNTGIYKKTFSAKWSNLSGFIIRNGTTGENGQTESVCADVSQNTYFYGTNNTPNTNLSQLNGTAKVINMVSVDNGTSYNELASGCVTTVSGYNLPSNAVSTTAVSSSTSSTSSNASIEAAFGSTITYSAKADTNYEFKGFSTTNSSSLPGNLNTKATMTQTSSAINGNSNDVYYAYYVAKNIQTPVAQSVKLTASPETVTSGGSTKLTATLTNKATGVGNVTYTFKSGDTTVGTFENTADTTASVNVDNITSDTTYTVTVSATDYSDVTDTATVTVKQLENWYLIGDEYNKWNQDTTSFPMTYDSATGCYFKNTTITDATAQNFFRLRLDEGDKKTQYGPSGSNDATIKDDSVKTTVTVNTSKAFEYKGSSLNYTIWLDSSKKQIWITSNATHYNVTYGVNDEAMGSVKATYADSTSIGESPASVEGGKSVTFTANPSKGFAVEGWYSDAGCTNKIESAGTKKTYTVTVNADTDVYVKFHTAKTCQVTFRSSDDNFGSVSAKYNGDDFTSGGTVTEGDEVTFTAKPEDGYALSGWTVNGVSASSTANPYTITVNKDTTVVANFKEMTGTLSGYYLLCGTDATFKVGSYTPVPLYTNEEGVFYADFNAADIPKKENYFIIFSTKKDTSGIIVDTNNVTVNAINKNGFSLSDYNENVQNQSGGTNNVKLAKVYIDKDEVTGFTINITKLDLNSKKITYSAEPKFKEAPKNAVNIIAKNGTQTAKFQDMGSTVITPVENVVFGIGKYNDYTQKATAIKGNKVTVTTTVDKDYKDTYYVKGFVVNGESYGIQSGPNDDGVYTLEYQIPDDVEDGTNFEITPVYFLKDNRNCVTFYVEGFDGAVQKSWGNTIACYPYYEGLSGATKDNAFGEYPGQPLLYEGGKYYTQIPKSITLDGVDKKIVGMTLNNFALELVHGAISTIKENKQSYDYDDFVRIANNNYGNNIIYTFKYSTVKDNFDGLDDPTVSPDKITEAEFASGTGNGWEDLTDYNHSKVDLFGNVLTDTDSKKEPLLVVSNGYFENYQGYYATEWTVYKKLEDGTYSKIAQIPSSALLLKSKDDLTNSTSDKKYENSLKSYADAYAKLEAYKNTPAKITFESSIKKGYSLQGHTNGGQGGELADRVDGRWYYSKVGEEITAKIAVEYGDIATSDFTKDPFEGDTNKTTTIGAHAYFTNDAASGKTTYKSNIDSSNYFTFTADTIATDEKGQNYVFLGWYLLSDEKYTKLTDAKAPMTGSDTFVARYVKAPEGTVTIDHKLFSAASNPTPTQNVGTGSGKCYVTVKVFDKTTGKFVKTFAETEKSVTLDGTYINSAKNYELQITLRTVTSGKDEFQKFYYLAQDKKTYKSIDTGTTTTTTTEGKVTTVTRKVDIRENFFKPNDDGITYSFRNETGSDSIHYYSDIKETKIPYKITFKYEPRLESDAKQYVVKGEFTSEYILKNGAELTKNFVMSVAPYEDNFFNTIKWDKDNITIDNRGTTKTAEIKSTTSSRTVTVQAFDAEDKPIKAYELNAGEPEFTSTVVYGSLLTYDNLCGLTPDEKTKIAGDKKYIYVAEPVHNGEKFSYWQISTSLNKDDTSAYVTKCFSQEFNYIAYNHYYIWPVYGKSQSITGASTTLNFLDYSRNQSTGLEGENKTDRVFADFALAFDSNGIQLKTYNGDNIKVGMFLEVCGDLESDSNGNVITDINHYKDNPKYSTSEKDLESIKNAILARSSTKSLNYTTEAGEVRKLLNKPIDIKSLDNKNRIEYYVGYNNNDNNQKKLMRAYSYVIVGNEITLCSTYYSFVNYYNVGNKTYTVS